MDGYLFHVHLHQPHFMLNLRLLLWNCQELMWPTDHLSIKTCLGSHPGIVVRKFWVCVFVMLKKNNQSECCIQYIECSDWTFLQYEYEILTWKFYGCKANCKLCSIKSKVRNFIFSSYLCEFSLAYSTNKSCHNNK